MTTTTTTTTTATTGDDNNTPHDDAVVVIQGQKQTTADYDMEEIVDEAAPTTTTTTTATPTDDSNDDSNALVVNLQQQKTATNDIEEIVDEELGPSPPPEAQGGATPREGERAQGKQEDDDDDPTTNTGDLTLHNAEEATEESGVVVKSSALRSAEAELGRGDADDSESNIPKLGGDDEDGTAPPVTKRQQKVVQNFPPAFYDPKTNKLMEDPVVDAYGNSYDRSTVDAAAGTGNNTSTSADGGTGKSNTSTNSGAGTGNNGTSTNADGGTGNGTNLGAGTGNNGPGTDSKNGDDQKGDMTYYPNRALKRIIQRDVELADQSMVGSIRRMDDVVQKSWRNLMGKSAFGLPSALPDAYYCPISFDLMVDPVIAPDGNSYERAAIVGWIRANHTSPLTRDPLLISQLRDNNALYNLIQNEKLRNEDDIHPSIRRWQEAGTTTRPDERVMEDDDYDPENPSSNNGNSFPTTYAELEAMEREARRGRGRRQRFDTILCFTFLAIIFVPPYIAYTALIISVLIMCYFTMHRRRPNLNNTNNDANGNNNNNDRPA